MLFTCFAAHEGLLWWQLACVETVRLWTETALLAWDWMEVLCGQR